MSYALLLSLHLLAALVWVGGMFFAHLCLRPAAVERLEPPQRLRLWEGVFQRFFLWVWLAIALLLGTGAGMAYGYLGSWAQQGWHVWAMQIIGVVMVLLFAWLYWVPYARLRQAIAAQAWPDGGAQLARIRAIVTINLLLGIALAVIAILGRFI